jgi:AraC-like DNA-binding protein
MYFSVKAADPWVAEAFPSADIASRVMPDAEHLFEYHLMTKGRCWVGIVGEEPILLETGDVVVFPQGDPHVLSSHPGMRGQPSIAEYDPPVGRQLPFSLHDGGTGEHTIHVVCGFLGCDARPFNPLLATLPRILKVSARGGGGWLEALVQLAVAESAEGRTGGECVLARASELMFVEVVRRYVASLPPEQTGWLAGLRDPFVGRALSVLHDRPAEPWTVESLAKEAALSRSALAERFTQLVGDAPMQYLTRWRMQLAATLLRAKGASVFEAATEVGYASEAAFSRAFKKVVGVSPAAWRERRTTDAPDEQPPER